MTDKQTGGPAFPASFYTDDGQWVKRDGMTLRDYFAAKAMQALIAATDGELRHHHGAYDAYQMADAMLKAREE